VKLAALGPKLASLAADIEEQARAQAQRTSTIAGIMDKLAHELDNAVTVLRSASSQMESELSTIRRIAYQTRLLSLNAAIEAERAGEQGAAFSVVVAEVKRLSDGTGQTASEIEERMKEMIESIVQVDSISSLQDKKRLAASDRNMAAVNRQVLGIASSTESQLQSVAAIHAMGNDVNLLTQSLLLAIGRFRFEAHVRAQRSVNALIPMLLSRIHSRQELELSIEDWLSRHRHFELAYVTDAQGKQFVDNIYLRHGKIVHDPAGYGRDWSMRPWFREAIQCKEACPTDIYQSSATGEFCFTIAASLRNAAGDLLGVFGSDVNFQLLVNE
jgi:hypothetical protein